MRTLLFFAGAFVFGARTARPQYTAPAVVPMQNAAPQQIQQLGQQAQQLGRVLSNSGAPVANTATATTKGSGQPIYVSCVIPADKKMAELNFDFILDEAAGTAAFYWNGQNTIVKETAVFTTDKVIWNQPFWNAVIRRTIDRVTLQYTDETIDGRKVSVSKGTCKVMTPSADRKF